ncbi:MAG: Fic family protein [Candidatus Azobacteroides sp.]|nr:Fic family protein [Candidatus Azobacteroides sp.]
MMSRIQQLHEEWQSLQPLKQEDQNRLNRKFMLEFNYNSNHIEGNTLTYGQTRLLLMFGETMGSANMRDYQEMKAHNAGLELVKIEAADEERPLTESFIRELNKIILVEDFWKKNDSQSTPYKIHVGVYKTRPNSVITATGEPFEYTTPEETPALMSDLVAWYKEVENQKTLNPIELAALFHYRYIRIHPFEDGNGRIARLLANYILFRHNYPMIVIKSDDKENYLQILHQCDILTGDRSSDGARATIEQISPFVDYFDSLVEQSLIIAIKAAKGESIDEPDDVDKNLALLKQRIGQNRDEQVKLTYSEESVEQAIENIVMPLLAAWEIKLKDFDSLFYKRTVKVQITYSNSSMGTTVDNTGKYFEDITILPSIVRSSRLIVKQIEAKTYPQGLIAKVQPNIDFNSGKILFQFFDNACNIHINDGTNPLTKSISKLYHQKLTEEETQRIVQALAGFLFDNVNQRINI